MGLFSRIRRRPPIKKIPETIPSTGEVDFLKKRGPDYVNRRVATLYRAKAKKEALIKANPNSPKARAWLGHISEYLKSIENLNSGRPDGYTGNPIGIIIGAPKLGA